MDFKIDILLLNTHYEFTLIFLANIGFFFFGKFNVTNSLHKFV